MPLPKPEPGLVIQYEYLWRQEHEAGHDQGSKNRPCAIVVAVTTTAGVTEVVVAPITHSEPTSPSEGIEIPSRVKQHLGLDAQRSWVVVTDLNAFNWPGFDIHPIPNAPPGTYDYGFLPPKLHQQIVDKINQIGSRTAATDRNEAN